MLSYIKGFLSPVKSDFEYPKSNISTTVAPIATTVAPRNSQALIQEIHDSFDNAQDELLCNAEKILKELNIETESGILKKAELLKEVGFICNPAVEKAEKIQRKETETQEAAALIRYYKQEYPFQKVLTIEQLNNICKKYNLIYAPVAHYKEEVPEKNLLEIKNAKALKEEDRPNHVTLITLEPDNILEDCPEYIRKQLIDGFEYEFPIGTWDRLDVITNFL